MRNCKKCNKEFTSTFKVEGKWKGNNRRAYCYECSPIGNRKQMVLYDNGKKLCTICKKWFPYTAEYFYVKGGKRKDLGSQCKTCNSSQRAEPQRRLKQLMVESKGGKCIICNYDKYLGALQFHHINPKEKELKIASVAGHMLTDKIKQELEKCVLVCASCHAEIHGGLHPQYLGD